MKLLKKKNSIRPKFSGVIEKFFGGNFRDTNEETNYLPNVPAVNISADNKEFDISLMVPGLNKKDLNIEIHQNYINPCFPGGGNIFIGIPSPGKSCGDI